MDNGLNDEAHSTLEAKAALLQELGYDGVGWRPGQVAEMRRELDRRKLKMFSFYVGARIGADEEPFDPNLPGGVGLHDPVGVRAQPALAAPRLRYGPRLVRRRQR